MSPATAKNADFSKVKDRNFNIKHLPAGDYPARITKAEDHEAKSGEPNWLLTFTVTGGPGKGATYPYYCGQSTDQLWKIRNCFLAAGFNVPKQKMKVDPNKLVGKDVGITLGDDTYNDKVKSVIEAVIPLSEVGDAPEDATEADVEVESVRGTDTKSGKKGKKDKGKKGKKAVTDDELEEIEIEEL